MLCIFFSQNEGWFLIGFSWVINWLISIFFPTNYLSNKIDLLKKMSTETENYYNL